MVRRRRSARKKTVYSGRAAGKSPARRGGALVVLVLAGLVVLNLYVFVWDNRTGIAAVRRKAETAPMAIPSAALQPDAAPAPTPAQPVTTIEGKVGASDTLGRVLKRSGLAAADADAVIRALSSVLDFRTIRAGQRFRIARRADGSVERFELELSKTRRVRATRNTLGELIGEASD